MKTKIFILTLATIFLIACGKDLMVYETNINTPVIESYLFTDASELSVKVYSMESFNEEHNIYSNPIKNLSLYINDILLTESYDGTYTLKNAGEGILNAGKICNLKFEYNNQTISATASMPSKTQDIQISQSVIYREAYAGFLGYDTIPDVVITWDNPNNSYYQVYINSIDQSTGSIPYNKEGFGKMMMQPFIGNSYTLKRQDMDYFGRYICVLYKVSNEYAELYERISSSDLANPVSFIENGLGIFTGISSDTISYTVVEISNE